MINLSILSTDPFSVLFDPFSLPWTTSTNQTTSDCVNISDELLYQGSCEGAFVT